MGLQLISIFLLLVVTNGSTNVSDMISDVVQDTIPECIFGNGDISFNLYNSDIPGGVNVDMKSKNIPLKNNSPIVFIIHGFTEYVNSTMWLTLINCWLNKYSANVIAVDWDIGACSKGGFELTKLLSYESAVVNTRTVGVYTAEFIMKLLNGYGVNLTDIIVIGHSLGAQIAGFTGKRLQENGGCILNEIWGLDPAGPGFDMNNCENRLCATDAKCVKVLHTSITFGTLPAIGTKDYYFNGGFNQPNCPLYDRPVCSHTSSIEYCVHMICDHDCEFIGKKWNISESPPLTSVCSDDTCSTLGVPACKSPLNGTFYVDTTTLRPDCTTLPYSSSHYFGH